MFIERQKYLAAKKVKFTNVSHPPKKMLEMQRGKNIQRIIRSERKGKRET